MTDLSLPSSPRSLHRPEHAPLRLVSPVAASAPGPTGSAGAAGAAATGPSWSTGLLFQVLDALSVSLLVLDAQGNLMLANRAARSQCLPGQPLDLSDGGLSLQPEELPHFQQGLRAARSGRWTMVRLSGLGDTAWNVGLVPLVDENDQRAAAVLCVLGTSDGVSDLGMTFFGAQHRLTPAELQVLRALTHGESPAEIAERSQVALCTVRTQLAAMREKTQTSSLRHLLLMMLRLPPVCPLV